MVAALPRLLVHATLVVVVGFWLLPTVGLLVNSFRDPVEISREGWWSLLGSPAHITFSSYADVFRAQGLGRGFANSLFIGIPSTLIPVMLGAIAAYAFAWMRIPARELMLILVIGLMVIPIQVTFVPVLRLFHDLHLAGSIPALWLAHTAYGLPFAIFLLRNYIAGLPRDVLESAHVDGAGHATIFLKLVLPLSLPALASVAIFQFLAVWNDLLVALIYVGPRAENQPMTLVVANLTSSLGGEWQSLAAAAFVMALVPLVVFFALQRHFVRGITAGAVKG